MIKKLQIENYGCIERLDVELDPFTVFVGPNASGKSTLLAASSDYPVRRLRIGRSDGDRILHDGVTRGWGSTGSNQLNLMIHFVVDHLRARSTVGNEILPAVSGGNLANILYTLPRRVRDTIAAELCALVPVFSDVDVRAPVNSQGVHEVVFEDRWNRGTWFTPAEVSDGSMFVLAYLTLLHLEPPPKVLRIEEPEHGLHPYLVQQLVDLFRKMSNGTLSKGRPPVQILLATHSATLLDALEPHEVRFVTRLASGEVRVDRAPTDRDDWREVYEDYERSLGGMWLAGGLGAVPGAE